MKEAVFVVRVQSRGMRPRLNIAAMAVCVILFAMVAGCGGRAADGTVAVIGVVLVNGVPFALAEGASGGINFQTKDGTYSGNARIAVNGTYGTRLRPGTYEVAVWAEGFPVVSESGQMPRAESLIAEKYRSTRTSGIQVEVPPNGGIADISLEK